MSPSSDTTATGYSPEKSRHRTSADHSNSSTRRLVLDGTSFRDDSSDATDTGPTAIDGAAGPADMMRIGPTAVAAADPAGASILASAADDDQAATSSVGSTGDGSGLPTGMSVDAVPAAGASANRANSDAVTVAAVASAANAAASAASQAAKEAARAADMVRSLMFLAPEEDKSPPLPEQDERLRGFFGIIDDKHVSTRALLVEWFPTFDDMVAVANHKDSKIISDRMAAFTTVAANRLYSVLDFVGNGGIWRAGLSLGDINRINRANAQSKALAVSDAQVIATNDHNGPPAFGSLCSSDIILSYEQSFDGSRIEANDEKEWEELPPILCGVPIVLNKENTYYDDGTKTKIVAELSAKLMTGMKWTGSVPPPKFIKDGDGGYLQIKSQIIRCNSYGHALCKKEEKQCQWKIYLLTRSDNPGE